MAEDFMVIPRSCSSGSESMYRILPASFGDIIPLDDIRESESVVLPVVSNRVSVTQFS